MTFKPDPTNDSDRLCRAATPFWASDIWREPLQEGEEKSRGGNSLFGGRFSALGGLRQPEDDANFCRPATGVKERRRRSEGGDSLDGQKTGSCIELKGKKSVDSSAGSNRFQVQIKSFLCKSYILSKNKRVILFQTEDRLQRDAAPRWRLSGGGLGSEGGLRRTKTAQDNTRMAETGGGLVFFVVVLLAFVLHLPLPLLSRSASLIVCRGDPTNHSLNHI